MNVLRLLSCLRPKVIGHIHLDGERIHHAREANRGCGWLYLLSALIFWTTYGLLTGIEGGRGYCDYLVVLMICEGSQLLSRLPSPVLLSFRLWYTINPAVQSVRLQLQTGWTALPEGAPWMGCRGTASSLGCATYQATTGGQRGPGD